MKLFDYIYEGGKNYIQVGEAKSGDYISEMIIHNNIDGFVPARLRSRNAENTIIYPITGLVPLTQLVEIKRISAEGMEALIRSFIKVMRSMDEYLLPLERLVIEPEHIYQNYGKKNEFLWIYGSEETKGREIVNLFEFLLDKIDDRDDRAVNLVYSLYQCCKNFQMIETDESLLGMLSMVGEKGEELLAVKENILEVQARKWMETEDRQALEYFRTTNLEGNEFRDRHPRYEEEEIENLGRFRERGAQKAKDREDNLRFLVENPKKVMEEFVQMESVKEKEVFSRREKKQKERREEKQKKKDEQGGVQGIKEHSASMRMKNMFQKAWNYLNADIGSTPEPSTGVEEVKNSYKLRDVKVVRASEEEGESRATTLLTNGMVNRGVYCLKSSEKGEEDVLITSYPFFIGKAEGDIHLKIDDSTVSRYHCRIDREDDVLWLTDLGSTNGTFLNGTRMIPFEKLKIVEGDNIVISRKKYLFSYMR